MKSLSNLNEKLKLFLGISFGVFLFILFFQPFPLDRFDFNNSLLFVAGFGVIIFLFLFLVRITYPWMINTIQENENETVLLTYLSDFTFIALSTVAFAFYLRYVGFVPISFYIIFKAGLIGLAPPVILRLYIKIQELKQQNESLIAEKKTLLKEFEKCEENNLNKTIEFISENNTENLSLLIADIAFIRSADNYVEIVYLEDDNFRKKLIRNTLKNIELQIKQYSNFIRCHRICIVNIQYIEKLNRKYSSHSLTIRGYYEQIPVSRQYLLKLKEAL